jgi:hypothetical protein
MRVTFDTNVFDKAVRPTIYSQDPDFREMTIVHQALKDARIQGFISETTITLEGIGRDDRATVFGSTHARSSVAQTADDTFAITLTTEQPDRRPFIRNKESALSKRFDLELDSLAHRASACRQRRSNCMTMFGKLPTMPDVKSHLTPACPRPNGAVECAMAKKLIRMWSMKSDRELMALSKTKTLEAIVEQLQRPPATILRAAKRLGLSIKRAKRK